MGFRIHIPRLVTVIISLWYVLQAVALPARPGLTTYYQADGSSSQVQIIGDEHCHYMLSADGHLVVDKEGLLFYARVGADGMPEPSAFRIGDVGDDARAFLRSTDTEEMLQALRYDGNRSLRGPGLKNNATFPLFGDQRAIVILV